MAMLPTLASAPPTTCSEAKRDARHSHHCTPGAMHGYCRATASHHSAKCMHACKPYHCGTSSTEARGRTVREIAHRRRNELCDPRAAEHHTEHERVPGAAEITTSAVR
eukprot:3356748-Pleurochrysis_carterae.AAC.3